MSWFTEIAGKAEDLLNRVDQTAATALQNKSRSSPYEPNTQFMTANSSQAYESSYSTGGPYSSVKQNIPHLKTSWSSTLENKSVYNPGTLTPRKKPESDDEKLLNFLNCNENLPSPEKKMKLKETEKVDNKDADVKPMTSTLNSKAKDGDVVCEKKPNENIQETTPELLDISSVTSNEISSDSTSTANNVEECDVKNSASELSLAEKRAEHAEAEMKRMMKRLDHWNSQISGNDKLVRELQERDKDMLAVIDAKDSQLAVLKVRLEEADQELISKRKIINELKAENEKIIKEYAESSAIQNKTIERLQNQLQQTEADLGKTQESFRVSQTEHMKQMSKSEEEHRHLVESYSSLQKRWNEVNERNKELISQLKNSNVNFETLQQEYNDYKVKAQRILQSKEKLISTLKEGNFNADSIEKNEASSALLNAEVEGIKQERDLLKEDLRRANELIETYRSEVQELEKISQNDLSTSQERCRILKEQFDMERIQKEEFQLANTQLKEELQMLKEDLARTNSNFQSRIHDREIEIEKLRRQLTAKSLSSVSQDELESRLHALTENLIQKQTVVEALSTEKNSLVLQLERLEQQLREAQNYGAQQHTYVGISNNEIERKAKTVFHENPFDSPLTRRVKSVYGTIDSLSIRLGVFFRRYPVARVFLIVYMLLLHFWVMIVLLTYEPEVHGSDHVNMKQQ